MTARSEAKERTRQRLLDAMLAILHESGPAALTTGRIAERAGLAQPTFYVHFPDLDRAIELAADEVGARLIHVFAAPRAAVEQVAGLPGGRLRLGLRVALESFLADRRTTELFLRHRRDTASPFAARFRAVLARGRDELRAMLERGGARSPETSAALILGMVIASVEGLLDGRVPTIDDAVDHLVPATRLLIGKGEPKSSL